MKRFVAVPAVILWAFLPVFVLQAEKLSEPIIAPKVLFSVNSEFVLTEPKLRTTLVVVRYPEISGRKYSLIGSCATVAKPVWSEVSAAGVRSEIFPVSVSADCGATSVRFSIATSGKTVSGSSISVPVMTRSALFTSLSDLSDNDLFVFARDSAASANKLLDSSRALISSSGSTQKEKLSGLALSYRAANLSFRSDDAFSLIRAREDIRYSVPVAGKSMPTDYPFIPGSMRPYRRDTTDGIHHGWDIMAAVWTPVRSVSSGVVVRVVSGFSWRDFDRLRKGANLSEDQKLLNLDIYRGNQIWLKTADGNVTFYSHLRDLAPGIREGQYVAADEMLGTVGVTGVPDRSYRNPHLHFEIQKNPHDGSDSKDPLSVMRWPYLGKGDTKTSVRTLTENAFGG